MSPLPAEFVDRLKAIVGAARTESVLASFASRRWPAIRINPLRGQRADVLAELLGEGMQPAPVSWYDDAYLVAPEHRERLSRSAAFAEGRIYIQTLSSMLAPLLLAPKAGEEILDLAAAPGGKTLQMAAMMRNEGRIAAVEAIRRRHYKLQDNLKRHGVTIVKTYLTDGRSVGRKTPERFDRVLLDAPCSSEARFHVDRPQSWAHWSTRKIREQSRKQKGLLKAAIQALKPGGTLVYCTCSFAPEENEQAIHTVLGRMEGYIQVIPMELPFANIQPGLTEWQNQKLHPDLNFAQRVLPTEAMEACFLCKLQKLRSTAGVWRTAP